MAASDVDMQAVSITPQTFLYDQDASLNATLARIQNEQIAKLTKQLPDRFLGLATCRCRRRSRRPNCATPCARWKFPAR
jgi:predicted TIM-barrel fold metal-dependent hydrolase